jgi:hypothetical protein
MAYWICKQCGVEFWSRNGSQNRPLIFCDRECYTVWRNAHQRENIYREYSIGDIRTRVSDGTISVCRKFIKISKYKWQHYAVWLWIEHYGRLLPGDRVHHLNGVHTDDRIENLIALPRGDHSHWHNGWGVKEIPEKWLNIYMNRYTTAMLGVC